MSKGYRFLLLGAGVAAALLLLRYLLPLVLPFVLGLAVAWAAEPVARTLSRRCRLPRGLATGLAIGGVYLLLLGLLYGLGRLALRELDTLSGQLPEAIQGLDQAAGRVRDWLYGLVRRAPAHIQPELEARIQALFSGGSALAEDAASKVLGAASQILIRLPDTFVFLGTAVISSFMISARLPRLRPWLASKLPKAWADKVLPVLGNLRASVGGWVRAQCKLMGITFLLLTAGFLVLRLRHPVLLGAVVALVDALPMLGTGTILLPWALLVLLQGQTALALGLAALYALTALTRSVLEPRLVGRQLGLNPLATLAALYIGYRLWGVLGMLLAPLLTMTLAEIWTMAQPERAD